MTIILYRARRRVIGWQDGCSTPGDGVRSGLRGDARLGGWFGSGSRAGFGSGFGFGSA